jgi:uncharacterized protein (DUF885 family)
LPIPDDASLILFKRPWSFVMSANRRDLLLGAAAVTASAITPAIALAAKGKAAAPAAGPGDKALRVQLDAMAEAMLAEYPENATSLGLDKAARVALKSRLNDRSAAGVTAHSAAASERLKTLSAVDKSRLSPSALNDLEAVRTAHELAVQGFKFPFGDVAILNAEQAYRNTPYAVSQGTGAYAEVPDLLDSHHQIETKADADAYLARMQDYVRSLDGETERLRADAARGVIAPDFLLDKTLVQITAFRASAVKDWGLVTSLVKRAAAKGLGDYSARAHVIAEKEVGPALDRQLIALTGLRNKATHDAGAWKLPDGEAYYAWALRAGTTTNLTPDEVHALGLEQAKALTAEMDTLLQAQGLTKGSVGDRLNALGSDPKYLFPDTDEGRAQILAYLNGVVADMRPRLPRAFATLKPGKLVIKRVPPTIQDGMPNGYGGAGSVDGSQPGFYYINLKTTAIWPKFSLPTLTYHEGIPGHVWQGEYAYNLPLIRSLLSFNAYTEGWALYAEQLGDELGCYDNDPLGRLGYLQSIQFRACRLVVDTGIHAKKWSREQATQWFADNNGTSAAHVQSEVDRYCAWPGQACGYKIGHSEINRLRTKAKAAMGARYDLRTFDDVVVKAGAVPLTLLGQIVDRYIAGKT